jgi:methionyl-tRNA formyltransferase
MNIVFFGTPDFSVICLRKLLQSRHKISCVVTTPDKERGRGRNISFTPVKKFALENNLPVLQPEKLSDELFIDSLNKISADLFIVVAFRILPSSVFTIPKYGTFNLHGSLLPKYRGAAPIQWALINGEKQTGVTTFFIKEKVDTGNIILQEKIDILPEDNFESLHDRMAKIGSEVILKTVDLIESGNVTQTEQSNSEVTAAPKISHDIALINWKKSSHEIHNLIRGLSPYPGAFFMLKGKQYKVFRSRVVESDEEINKIKEINDIVFSDEMKFYTTKKNIFAETGKGFVEILEIQPEGRKRMSSEEFLRGNKF